jgi:hypothetical protein
VRKVWLGERQDEGVATRDVTQIRHFFEAGDDTLWITFYFSPGKAGTLQEVFQDAAQNYYHSVGDIFSPMVFFDTAYWTETLPVQPLVESLFVKSNRGKEYKDLVLFTTDEEEAVEFLVRKAPPENQQIERWRAMGLNATVARFAP